MLVLLFSIVIIYGITISSAICIELVVKEYQQTGKIHPFELVAIALVVALNLAVFTDIFRG